MNVLCAQPKVPEPIPVAVQRQEELGASAYANSFDEEPQPGLLTF
jgi:hypothetical protein